MSSSNDNRKMFTNKMRADLFEKLQQKSKESKIPISRLLDQAVESFLNDETSASNKKSFIINNENLYQFYTIFFGLKGLNPNEEVEKILLDHMAKQKMFFEEIVNILKDSQDKVTENNGVHEIETPEGEIFKFGIKTQSKPLNDE